MDLGGEGYTPFERELLFHVLETSTRAADDLKVQIALSRVVGRTFSGQGSFTEIEVSSEAPSVRGTSSVPTELHYVGIWRPELQSVAGCLVFIGAAGYVDLLEVYTHGPPDVWHDDPAVWKIVAGDLETNPFDRPPNP